MLVIRVGYSGGGHYVSGGYGGHQEAPLQTPRAAAELAAAAELVTRDRELGSTGSQSEDEHEGSTGHPRLGGTLRHPAPLRPQPMPAAPDQLRLHSHVNGSNARAQLDNTLRR